MSYKNNVSVRVCGRTLTLSGSESVEYITKVANYIEEKAMELRNSDSAKKLNPNLVSVLTSINIADDYFKELEKNSKLKEELEFVKSGEDLGDSQKISISKELEEKDSKISLLSKENETLKEEVAKKVKEVDELTLKIEELENDLKRQVAKVNHFKSMEYKLKTQRSNNLNLPKTEEVVEIQEAIITSDKK